MLLSCLRMLIGDNWQYMRRVFIRVERTWLIVILLLHFISLFEFKLLVLPLRHWVISWILVRTWYFWDLRMLINARMRCWRWLDILSVGMLYCCLSLGNVATAENHAWIVEIVLIELELRVSPSWVRELSTLSHLWLGAWLLLWYGVLTISSGALPTNRVRIWWLDIL